MGKIVPRPKNLRALATYFDVPVSTFLHDSTNAAAYYSQPVETRRESGMAVEIRKFMEDVIGSAGPNEALLGWVLTELRQRLNHIIRPPEYGLNDLPVSGSQLAETIRQLARAESERKHPGAPPSRAASGPPPPVPPVATVEQTPKTRATAPSETSLKS